MAHTVVVVCSARCFDVTKVKSEEHIVWKWHVMEEREKKVERNETATENAVARQKKEDRMRIKQAKKLTILMLPWNEHTHKLG